MNLKETQMKLEDYTKKGLDWIGKVFVVIGLAIVLYSIGAQASSATIPLTPQAQRTFEANRVAFCEAEKSLAQSKLADYSNGNLNATPDQVKTWAEKMGKDCMGF